MYVDDDAGKTIGHWVGGGGGGHPRCARTLSQLVVEHQ